MIKIDPNAICTNVKKGLNELMEDLKIQSKYTLPYLFAATVFYGFSEQAVMQPAEKVDWVVSKILQGSVVAAVIGGCLHLIKKMDEREATLQGRNVEMITIPKEEYEKLKAEIERLKPQDTYTESDSKTNS